MFNDTRKKHVVIAPSFGCKLSFLRFTESNIGWDFVLNDRDNYLPRKRRQRAPTGLESPGRAGGSPHRPHWPCTEHTCPLEEGVTGKLGPGTHSGVVVTKSGEPRSNICEFSLCRGLREHTVVRHLAIFVFFHHSRPKL